MPPRVASEGTGRVRIVFPRGGESAPPSDFRQVGFRPPGAAAALGRGGAIAIEWPDGRRCFYREFRHGGWFGRLLAHRYLTATPLEREIEDSQRLARAGVDVARPVAGRIERGVFLRLALVTERIEGRALVDELRSTAIPGPLSHRLAILRNVGRLCARMHAAGFRHKDLHPGNLVVRPDGSVALLDLQGGRWGGQRGDRSARSSLVRMARYLEKHDGAAPSPRVILALLQGYEPERTSRHGIFRRLARLYARKVRRHRVLWGRQVGLEGASG